MMNIFKVAHVHEAMRPFFPYRASAEDKNTLILEKQSISGSHLLLVGAVMSLAFAVITSKASIFLGAFVITLTYIISVSTEGYSELKITPKGITLIRKILPVRFATFIGRQDIQSVLYHVKTQNEQATYGRIEIVKRRGRNVIVIRFARRQRIVMIDDARIIAHKIGNLLEVPCEEDIANQAVG